MNRNHLLIQYLQSYCSLSKEKVFSIANADNSEEWAKKVLNDAQWKRWQIFLINYFLAFSATIDFLVYQLFLENFIFIYFLTTGSAENVTFVFDMILKLRISLKFLIFKTTWNFTDKTEILNESKLTLRQFLVW